WALTLDGESHRLYDLDTQRTYQRRLEPRMPREGLLPYVNPPHTALPLAPLALLSRSTAFYLWSALQLLLLLLALHFLYRLTPGWERLEHVVLAVTVLAFPPMLMTFQLGQLSLLLLVCLLGV